MLEPQAASLQVALVPPYGRTTSAMFPRVGAMFGSVVPAFRDAPSRASMLRLTEGAGSAAYPRVLPGWSEDGVRVWR